MKFVQHLIKAFKDWRYLPTQFLISKLKKSESAEIRSYAAEALGAIGDANANQPLIDALQDTNNSVRRFAIQHIGDELRMDQAGIAFLRLLLIL